MTRRNLDNSIASFHLRTIEKRAWYDRLLLRGNSIVFWRYNINIRGDYDYLERYYGTEDQKHYYKGDFGCVPVFEL